MGDAAVRIARENFKILNVACQNQKESRKDCEKILKSL